MLVLAILAILGVANKSKVSVNTDDNISWINREQTQTVLGVFVLLILISHTSVNINTSSYYQAFRAGIGQFVVVPFFFFSGFGIMHSIKTKEGYIKRFIHNRAVPLWLNFSIITVIYVVVNILCHNKYTLTEYLLSFTGYFDIGNGGWFIFATFELYIILVIVWKICKNNLFSVIGFTALVFLIILIEYSLKLPTYYFNTLLFFPLGMIFNLVLPRITHLLKRPAVIIVGIVFFAAFILLIKYKSSIIVYPIWCFCGLVVVLAYINLFKFNNPLYLWIGKNAFPFFMLQHLPMIIINKIEYVNPIIYVFVVIVSTMFLTYVYNVFKKMIKQN